MDLSNFNFSPLDQVSRDETLAQLSYPFIQGFNWDSSYPIEPTTVAWQQDDADAHAFNEPQGAV
jgi:hypothetical protein